MLQRSLSASRVLTQAVYRRHEAYRHSSTSSAGKGTHPMSVAAAVSSAGVGGIIGYAFFDPEFRLALEKNIPGASEVFSSLFGSKSTPPQKPQSLPAPPPAKVKVTRIPEPEIIEPPKKAAQLTKEKEPSVPTEVENKESIAHTFKTRMILVEALLKETASATQFSNEATKSHIKLLQEAMEGTDDDNTWDKVFQAASLKREANKKAGELIEKTNSSIKELIHIVESGKKELDDKGHLAEAQKSIQKAIEDLQDQNNKMLEAQKSAKLVDDFREMVEKGKKALQTEFASILPPGGPETKEDFELFIQHAYKKILSLQMDIAKKKTLEQQKFDQIMWDAQVDKKVDIQNAVQSALDAQRIEFQKEKVRIKADLHEEMEAELRVHLKRQAAAHYDLLNDMKDVQEMEMSRKYERLTHETLLRETNSQKAKMSEMMAAYEGLVVALEKRGHADENILNAQNLWLSATNLYQSVQKGGVPLKSEVEELKKYATNEEDKLVIDVVLKTVDSVSMETGVLSEEEMRHRFLKVERLANQTAMIGPEGASPFVYLLSYLRSKLIRSQDLVTPINDIEPEFLDTHDIVSLARFSVDRGNFEQAVKYMTLLKGRPKSIAQDWISDARRILELKQACEVIIAQASSSGVQFPSK